MQKNLENNRSLEEEARNVLKSPDQGTRPQGWHSDIARANFAGGGKMFDFGQATVFCLR